MAFAIINGLTTAMAVFLVAAGLTLMFGILRVLNFAHGAFFMIGAYVAWSLLGDAPDSLAAFIGGALGAAALVGALGLVVDQLVLRRLRHVDEHYMLIATFAVLLICVGVAKMIWGMDFHSADPPPFLDGGVAIAGLFLPKFSLFVIATGFVVFLALEIAIHRLWLGKMVTALAADGWMANLLGVNVPLGTTLSVVASFALAGLAGGLLLPNQALSPALGDTYLLLAFTAVIIGGLGNVRGAFIASILLGMIESFNALLLPNLPGLAVYLGMIAFLLLRPNGLFGASAS
ncbi:branched-chain amino acid ABC transporter permease [Terrarubrum flagellatum]|uniref:branched-chain amino acid ABC transporter permease n=1 Tax=Terrirubrum flagellatum TaxID=2895980 RepID=UPI003144D46B